MDAKSKLQCKRLNETWDSSNWRRDSVLLLVRLVYIPLFSYMPFRRSPMFFPILGHVIAIDVFHKYMCSILQDIDRSQGASSHPDGTKPTLIHLSALLSTSNHCFCDEGVDKVGGHCQKLCSGTFSFLLVSAFSQLIKTVATYLHQGRPEEFQVSSLEIYTSTTIIPLSSLREPQHRCFSCLQNND